LRADHTRDGSGLEIGTMIEGTRLGRAGSEAAAQWRNGMFFFLYLAGG